jgi:hypothetical protein
VAENRIFRYRIYTVPEDCITDCDIGNASADLVHYSRRLEANPRGQSNRLGISRVSGTIFPIRWIHTRCPHGDPHLSRTGMGFFHLDDPQDFRAAISAELNCFHESLS